MESFMISSLASPNVLTSYISLCIKYYELRRAILTNPCDTALTDRVGLS